jgi:hypothetical protein
VVLLRSTVVVLFRRRAVYYYYRRMAHGFGLGFRLLAHGFGLGFGHGFGLVAFFVLRSRLVAFTATTIDRLGLFVGKIDPEVVIHGSLDTLRMSKVIFCRNVYVSSQTKVA